MGQIISCLTPAVHEQDQQFEKGACIVAVDTAACKPSPITAAVASDATTAATTGHDAGLGSSAKSAAAADGGSMQKTADSLTLLGRPTQPNMPYEVGLSGPPLPPCQDERMEALQLGSFLDAAPRKELQSILQLVCSIFKTQHALIALLFDRRVYVINGTGNFQEGDFPWRYSFCGWTMASEQHVVMVVNDAHNDARFINNPVAKKYDVRFYAGAPLVSSSGHRLGTLCFADNKPRTFDDSSMRILCNFSELVTRELERDIALARQKQQAEENSAKQKHEKAEQYHLLLRSIDCVTSAVLLVDTSKPGWPVLYANRGWQLLQQQQQHLAKRGSAPPAVGNINSTSCSSNAAMTNSAGQLSAGYGPGESAAAGAAATSIVGQTLLPRIEQQLQEQAAVRRSTAAAGGADISCSKQVMKLVRDRQSFTLSGIVLDDLGGAPVSLAFRSASLGNIEGAVSLCLPSYIPDAQSSHVEWNGMYFVTVQLPQQARAALNGTFAAAAEGSSAAAGSTTITASRCSSSSSSGGDDLANGASPEEPASGQGPHISLSACKYPQIGQRYHGPAATAGLPPRQNHWQGTHDDHGLVVISSTQFQQIGQQNHYGMSTDDNNPGDGSSRFPVIESSKDVLNSASSAASSVRFSGESFSSVLAARIVCKKIEGLKLGGQIAAGSYGRVFRGDYFGTNVAVKVLDGDAVLRRESASGLCLEALLGEQFKHPNIVATLAWAVVTGKERIPRAVKLWGETLGSGRHGTAENGAATKAAPESSSSSSLPAAPVPAAAAVAITPEGTPVQQLRAESFDDGMQAYDYDFPDEYNDPPSVEGQTWMVMEYCDRGCLQDSVDCGWLRESASGPVSLVKVIATAAEVAAGLMVLHKAGVVHGDLSAYNVLLTSNDAAASIGKRGFVAKISDFGLSRSLEHKSKVVTKTYGTITHMPPELLEKGIASKAADVYSFGVLLWQMICGSRAWAGMSHSAVVKAVCIDKLQLQFPEDTPEAVAALGQSCMAYDPEDRPTLEDVWEVLGPLNEMIVSAEVD